MIRNGQVVVDQPLFLARAGAVLEHRPRPYCRRCRLAKVKRYLVRPGMKHEAALKLATPDMIDMICLLVSQP